MSIQYFKRYRMEYDLVQLPLNPVALPAGYSWVSWRPDLLERHASVKVQSFKQEIDAQVFPCLADYYGCYRLMQEIAFQRNFCPEATWLLSRYDRTQQLVSDVGTIQGLCPSEYFGSIQNIGIIPGQRGMGLGRALVLKSLDGFRLRGLKRATLEVTATNSIAVELYRSIGFCITRTMYREANSDQLVPI